VPDLRRADLSTKQHLAAMIVAIPALAHSWYPLACCGNMDCFPVACDQLVETVSGWLYVPTGNLFDPEQVQPSQDHHCHVCVGHGDHRSICAFIVPRRPNRKARSQTVGRGRARPSFVLGSLAIGLFSRSERRFTAR
jgi:hypothetical protein